jgi:hypothetical protein
VNAIALFSKFIGKNWFQNRDAINELAAKHKLSTSIKVRGEDVADIMDDDSRLTIHMAQDGKIIAFHRG